MVKKKYIHFLYDYIHDNKYRMSFNLKYMDNILLNGCQFQYMCMVSIKIKRGDVTIG